MLPLKGEGGKLRNLFPPSSAKTLVVNDTSGVGLFYWSPCLSAGALPSILTFCTRKWKV
jgi:hypothetical protein